MNISKREFLKRFGLAGAALATGGVRADEYCPDMSKLPAGSCGDPENVWFGKHIFPLAPSVSDGPSCCLKDGKVIEPAHELPVFHTADVVVVGGGPAGFAAAVAAARTGAKVALVERYGSLGGLFTNGMVLIVLATSLRDRASGKWSLVTRGICEEFMQRAGAFGTDFCRPAANTCPKNQWLPTIDPECAKYLMDEMVAESKVDMFFHCWGVDVIQDGDKVQGVVFESKEGRKAILAKQVVDCTGDADLLFKAGGEYHQVSGSITTVFRWGNMDTIVPPAGEPAFPTRGNEGNPDARWGGRSMNTANGLSVKDLSRIEVSQRRENWEYVQKMRATPGWEKVYTTNSASQIGVRQTRLIDAEYVIGRKEIAEGLAFDDTIGWCGHDGPHAAFPVCYRQILPKRIDNLLCAGRCLGKGDTIDTFRLIAPCFVTGQAAGTAAALAALKGVTPRALDRSLLQKTLRDQNVYLG